MGLTYAASAADKENTHTAAAQGMGNAGGFSSVGPTSDADGSTQKQTHGDGDHHGAFEMNNGQLEEMARNLDGMSCG